jgi:hypothetical protein
LEPIPPRRGGDGTVAYDVDADEKVARDADEEGMPDANNGVWAVLFKKKTECVSWAYPRRGSQIANNGVWAGV